MDLAPEPFTVISTGMERTKPITTGQGQVLCNDWYGSIQEAQFKADSKQRTADNTLDQQAFTAEPTTVIYWHYYSTACHFGCLLLILNMWWYMWRMQAVAVTCIIHFISLTGWMPIQWHLEAFFFCILELLKVKSRVTRWIICIKEEKN